MVVVIIQVVNSMVVSCLLGLFMGVHFGYLSLGYSYIAFTQLTAAEVLCRRLNNTIIAATTKPPKNTPTPPKRKD